MLGKQINNYVIQKVLGQGGMGTVYLAEHPLLGRRVAIKTLKRELLEDRGLVQRFINEARAAAAIRHRNIIDIIDVGKVEDDVPYIMMEFLDGESLAARIHRAGRIRVGDAVEFAFQAADALAAAHRAGIIHRDLKPENLFLIADPLVPGREIVKVLDFGIAKLRGDWQGDSFKTGTGSIMGTPPYMAPEQCRGLHNEIDARTDVYALGTILFEMLCGRPPFVAEGWGDVLVAHITQDPPIPSLVWGGIPPFLDGIVLKALAKQKSDRFSDMQAFQRALGEGRAITVANAEAAPAPAPERSPPLPVETVDAPAPAGVKSPDQPPAWTASVGETRIAPAMPVEPRPTHTTLSAATHSRSTSSAETDSGASRRRRVRLVGVIGAATGVVAIAAFGLLRGAERAEVSLDAPSTTAAAAPITSSTRPGSAMPVTGHVPDPAPPPSLLPDAGVTVEKSVIATPAPTVPPARTTAISAAPRRSRKLTTQAPASEPVAPETSRPAAPATSAAAAPTPKREPPQKRVAPLW